MSKEDRAQMYQEFLAEEGYVPKIDEDGDVIFKCEGRTYCISIEEDEDFFRLILPNFWSIDSEEERVKVTEAASQATARTKVAKVYPVNDDTWAAVEMFCSPPSMVKPVFRRCMGALQAGVRLFHERMQEEWQSLSAE